MLNLRLPFISSLKSIRSSLIVLKSIHNLLLSVHHKRPMLSYRFINWLSSNQQKSRCFVRRECMLSFLIFRFLKNTASICIHFSFLIVSSLPFKHEDDCVPLRRNGNAKLSIAIQLHIKIVRWSSVFNWALDSSSTSTDYFDLGFIFFN